jgi:hypothetical protein
MRRWVLLGALVGCHGGSPASTAGSAGGSGTTCAAKLDELARFYDAVAADNATATPRAPLGQAAIAAGVDALPEATGQPVDLRNADVLLVGPAAIVLVPIAGDVRRLDTGGTLEHVDAPPDHRALVIEIDGRVPWQRVEEVREMLGKTDRPYPSIGVAYSVKGARAGRVVPQVPGSEPGHIDIAKVGDALAKTVAAHCPDYAKQLAAFQNAESVSDPVRVRMLGATISHCDCGVDTALVELLPWLVAQPLVTVVPLASTGPALHGADGATWGDLVRDAKGPVPMAMPAPLPPPPPPPPPRRR